MKRVIAPLLLVLLAVVADVAFTQLSGHEGLLAPFGPVRLSTLVLGVLALATRLVATTLALPWLAWRLTSRVRERLPGTDLGAPATAAHPKHVRAR